MPTTYRQRVHPGSSSYGWLLWVVLAGVIAVYIHSTFFRMKSSSSSHLGEGGLLPPGSLNPYYDFGYPPNDYLQNDAYSVYQASNPPPPGSLLPPPVRMGANHIDPRVNSPFWMPASFFAPPSIPSSLSASMNMPSSQLGYLTKAEGSSSDSVLPLMGNPATRNRNRWRYYTVTDQRSTNVKLPIHYKGRDATSENGCDEIQCGDTVKVNGETYKVNMYNKDSAFHYSPF